MNSYFRVLQSIKKEFKLSDIQLDLVARLLRRTENYTDVCIKKYNLEYIKLNKKMKNPPYYLTYKEKGTYIFPLEYNRNISDYEIDYFHRVNKKSLDSVIIRGIVEQKEDFYILTEQFKKIVSNIPECKDIYKLNNLKS